MLKIGDFTNKLTGEVLYYICESVKGKGERIELYKNIEDYSTVETYNAEAAYFRKTREYYLGNEELIKSFLEAQNMCITLKGEIKQTTEFVNGKFQINQIKENSQLGLVNKTTLVNGLIVSEYYETPKYIIEADGISEHNTTVFSEPLNIRDYKLISILTSFDSSDYGDADYYSADYLKSRFPLEHIENYDYVVVQDEETANERFEKWLNAPVKFKAIDIESTGLEVSVFGEDKITGVVLSYDWEPLGEVENSTYFPFRQKNFKYNLPIEFLHKMTDKIAKMPRAKTLDLDEPGVLLTAHNGKMESKSFWCDGCEIHIDLDTYTLSTLYETKMAKGLHTLKNRVKNITGLFWLELEDIFKDKNIRFDILPIEIVKLYACADGPNTIRLAKWLLSKLPKTEMFVANVDCKLQRMNASFEWYGLRLNQEKLIKDLKNTEYIVETLSKRFKEMHNTTKNINSSDVLRDIIYNKLGCKVVVKTKKNKPSTSVDAVKLIMENGQMRDVDLSGVPMHPDILDLYGNVIVEGKDLMTNKYPSIVILHKYNVYKKELGALRRLQKKSIMNRVMFGINGTGAASGRQTSDAHQYSNTMKSLVLADTPEHTLISADYSQVELRVLAYVIQDKRLIAQMKDKHIDIHRAFLSVINNIPVYMISSDMRSKGKRVNFGVVYGISKFGLVKQIYGAGYTEDQLEECDIAITDFYNGIPGCKEHMQKTREFIFKHGYIEDGWGHRRTLPEALNPDLDDKQKDRIFRQANNTPIQGFAAYLMKQAELNYEAYIEKMGWNETIEYMGAKFPKVRVMLSIHDEVLISAHDSIPKEEIIKMCKECMEIEIKDAPPFFAVPAFISNWYEGKADAFDMSVSMRDDILTAWEKGERIVDWTDIVGSIKKYKLAQIKEYMDNLIMKYKTVDEVTKHVTHPEYTHLLISIYVSKKEVSENEHVDCIRMAVENYMSNSDITVLIADVKDETEIKESYEQYLGQVDEYFEVDEHGEILAPDEDITDPDDETYKYMLDDEKTVRFFNADIDVLYMGNTVIIDTSDIPDVQSMKQMYREIVPMCSSDGYYQVCFMRGEAMLPTTLKMEPNKMGIINILNKYKCKN